MTPTKHERFRELLAREGLAVAEPRGIPRRTGPRECEASFAQRRIWVNQMLDRDSTSYNILLAMKVEGRLSHAGIAQALQTIVDRHEALRTCFKVVGGKPYQTARPAVPVHVDVVDLSGLGASDGVLSAVLAGAQKTKFSLDRAPLFTFTLVRAARDVHVLLVALHHIIFDFVSSQVLADEFSRLYARYVKGLPCVLPEPRIHYLDYSEWQKAQFEQSDAASTLQLWKEAIGAGDDIPIVDLPGDRPSAAEAVFQPACESCVVPSDLAGRVARLSRETGVSSFCIWLAAFQLLLHRYTDADDILLSVPHSQRDDPDVERAIGFFVNPIVVRLRVRRHESFRTLLRAVNDDYLDAIGPRAYPFDKLVEALSPRRYQGLTRLGEIGFGYQRATQSAWSLGPLRVSFLDVNVPIAKSELSFSIYEDPERCRGYFEYNAARFSSHLVAQMAEHYCGLLAKLLGDPDRPVGSIAYVTQAQRDDLVRGSAADDRPSAECLHALFERQAQATPDATALVMEGDHVSYRALNRHANQLARRLVASGAGLHSAVGLRMPRSIDAYACVLAILKSGGAYVPMDPSHPPAYLLKMIDIADVRHVIVSGDAGSLRVAAAGRDVRTIDAAELVEASRAEAERNLDVPVSGEHPAYVCFTSGSTGESKGVVVAHRAITSHMQAFLRSVPIESADRVLQFSALTFDVSLEQVFSAWVTGSTLLPRGDEIWSVRELIDFLVREQVTVANPPTAYWNQVVKAGTDAGLSVPQRGLRYMIAGGEAMLAETARRWRRMSSPGMRLVNAYGPTEAVITATLHHVIDPDAYEAGTSVPIGRALPGVDAYVLDRHGLPAPSGAPGELCLAGVSLSNGYLKSPRLTADCFRPAPRADLAGEAPGSTRLYRTGDWVRRLPDGTFEYLQRKDDEVKIRGVRVTPTQLESVLLENDAIAEAAVVVRVRTLAPPPALTPPDESRWRELLARLPAAFVEQAIREAEESHDGDTPQPAAPASAASSEDVRIVKHAAEFDIALDLRSPEFIATPRSAQRNWVVNRALEECADDLRELHELTRRFVAGSDRGEIVGDLSRADPGVVRSTLVMDGQQVMLDWQKPLMRELARAVAERHGDVLEIGFGMGISAGYIQEQGVRSHVIIEANDKVADAARRWREGYPKARIRIVHAKWQEVIDELDRFDGILFDTYPLTEAEFRRHVLSDVTFAGHFFPYAAQHLTPDGVFTYYSNEIDSVSRRHQRALLKSFASFRVAVVRNLYPPADSQNWWADSMAVVRAYKQ